MTHHRVPHCVAVSSFDISSGRDFGGPSRRRDDRGSISIWFATTSFIMVVLVGLVVDVGGQVQTQQHARAVAAQAARAGAQELDATSVKGRGLAIDPGGARVAAIAYLRATGVAGTVTVSDGTLLTVRTTDTYRPKFLSIIGVTRMTVTGEGSARLIQTPGSRT
ncbi:pilus assembly protein TadG-related protein [Nocardioides okcheonensis]|uniref:pilus assembly protein TadG-related protein n=1 Tax=Nocardioides okcheonensis TaxID=2894081 RepID=UPI001E3CA8FE|nr:pilus assembly protein TadG-related protein [Nocardioides okcheonensis]UFN45206.1 pilus assembly protein TadG-related protein [Nocardioides okcheonensis]